MELTLAIAILTKQQTDLAAELGAIQLALSVLEGTYAPELETLSNANEQAAELAQRLSVVMSERDVLAAKEAAAEPTDV